MKKYIISIILAIISGTLFGLYMFEDIKNEPILVNEESYKITVFQMGVFSDKENALNYVNTLNTAVIYQENNYYKVFSAAYNNELLISNLENYYLANNVNYILKELIIDNDKYEKLIEYENLLTQSENMEVIFKTNELILNTLFS